jgi:hypothetical protein
VELRGHWLKTLGGASPTSPAARAWSAATSSITEEQYRRAVEALADTARRW